MDRIKPNWIEVDCNRPKWIEWTKVDHKNRIGPKWTEVDRIRPKQTGLDQNGPKL